MLRSHPLSRSCSTGLLILPGVGIAVPIFIPAIVTAVVSLLLSRSDAAPPGSARRSPQSAGPAPSMAFFSPAERAEPRNVHTTGQWRTFRAPFYASA